jgi:branched-chain amino acid transport system substrate-binding protein
LTKLNHAGVIGNIKFDAKGQANPQVYVTQWCTNGSRRILYPDSAKAGCGAG